MVPVYDAGLGLSSCGGGFWVGSLGSPQLELPDSRESDLLRVSGKSNVSVVEGRAPPQAWRGGNQHIQLARFPCECTVRAEPRPDTNVTFA